MFEYLIVPGTRPSEELLAERRAEADRENEERSDSPAIPER
jgi:hypothetical protein